SYQTVTVSRQSQDGTATTADSDYTALGAANVTFTPGQTSQQVTVNANGDTKFETDEAFNLKLSTPTNATIADDTGVGTIQNDDTQPTISVNDVSHAEGNSGQTAYAFTISLSNPSYQTVTVSRQSQDGSATTADSDYTAIGAAAVTFTPGQTSQQVTVNANGDTKFEPDEAFNLKLTTPTNATIADDTGVGTIQNDDAQPTISVNEVSHAEGNSGQTAYAFTISLSNPSYQTVTVSRQSQDGTATTADSDYTAIGAAAVTFTPGQTSQQVTVNANGDTKFEPDEAFNLKPTTPTNATIADDTGVGTIQNDDAQPTISVNEVSHAEGNSGQTAYAFT